MTIQNIHNILLCSIHTYIHYKRVICNYIYVKVYNFQLQLKIVIIGNTVIFGNRVMVLVNMLE